MTWMVQVPRGTLDQSKRMKRLPTTAKEIWFLTGSQNLYGEQTLKEVAAQSEQVSSELAKGISSSVKLVWKPVLKTPDAIRRTMLDATADDNRIGVIN